MTQSIGQLCVLHAVVADTARHPCPPHAGCTSTERVRDCEPPPHDFVHTADQAVQSVSVQSTGQHCVLQTCVSVSWGGHAMPPEMGVVVTVRERSFAPLPQGCEHAPHRPHCESTQSTGQLCWWQLSLAVTAGHASPLWAAATIIERDRDCVPPPHDLVQADKAVQSDTTQSTGQGSVAHTAASCRLSQLAPPQCCDATTVRVRTFSPVPHAFVHADHPLHSLSAQSCLSVPSTAHSGQMSVLQVPCS